MKRLNSKNINTKKYWDEHIAEPDLGLRQKKYLELAGKGNNIIEFGCGLSPFLDKARKNFKQVWGIDFSNKTRSLFKWIFAARGIALSNCKGSHSLMHDLIHSLESSSNYAYRSSRVH